MPDCPHCSQPVDGWVPEDRLQKVTRQRTEAKQQLEALQAKYDDATERATRADELADQLASWEAKGSTWSAEKAIMAAGITDPEGIDFARLAFERLGEDAPPGGIAEWLTAPDALPKAVRAYLPESSLAHRSAQDEPAPPTPPGAKPPPPNRGAQPTPGPADSYRPGQVASMRPNEVRTQYEGIWAQLGVQAPKLPGRD